MWKWFGVHSGKSEEGFTVSSYDSLSHPVSGFVHNVTCSKYSHYNWRSGQLYASHQPYHIDVNFLFPSYQGLDIHENNTFTNGVFELYVDVWSYGQITLSTHGYSYHKKDQLNLCHVDLSYNWCG